MGYLSTDTILQCCPQDVMFTSCLVNVLTTFYSLRAANICSFVHTLHLLDFLDKAGGADLEQ